MPRNLQVASPIVFLRLHDAALDNVIYVAVADGAVFALPMIKHTEDWLNFLRLLLQPVSE